LTIHICERIEENYSDIQIVFSGRRGFHIHVLDFDLRDWTRYNERDPIKNHEVARFRYSKVLAGQCYGFNRAHFIVASDPMRIVTVPCTLNAEGRLICVHVGSKKDLETLEVEHLLDEREIRRPNFIHFEWNAITSPLGLSVLGFWFDHWYMVVFGKRTQLAKTMEAHMIGASLVPYFMIHPKAEYRNNIVKNHEITLFSSMVKRRRRTISRTILREILPLILGRPFNRRDYPSLEFT